MKYLQLIFITFKIYAGTEEKIQRLMLFVNLYKAAALQEDGKVLVKKPTYFEIF